MQDGRNWLLKTWDFLAMCVAWIAEKLHLAYFAELICAQLYDHVDHFHPEDLELGS